MTLKTLWRSAALALAGGLLPVLASGCGRATSAPAAPSAVGGRPADVRTVHPERGTLKRMVEQPGQIEGYE